VATADVYSGVSHRFAPSVCVPDLVAARAAERPKSVAVCAGTQVRSELTYGELNQRAGRLAGYLRSLGVGRDILVGLCLPRSPEMAVAALGIWKAGGAYVPMDPAYPAERLAFMLDDAQAPLVICNSAIARRLQATKSQIAKSKIIDIAKLKLTSDGAAPVESSPTDISPRNLAYVIYTSGSTGKPKGEEITHGGLANLVGWHRQAFSPTPADRASHLAGLGFDAAVWELWPYLAAGASVHLADELTRNSAELLRDWLVAQGISISFVPTPLAERLLTLKWPRRTALRILLTGGDTLHHYPPAGLPFGADNNYGPTERTVVATSAPVAPDPHPGMLPPIGRAIANTEIYLLDERLEQVAAGAPGEIYIGGAGLARGYHNRPDLTEQKFIPNPFSTKPGARLYKSGDLARRLPDGQLAFLGRTDDQVKIRGHRIEPNEIVSILGRHPQIRESLVLAREDRPGDPHLVAYLALDSEVRDSGLRDFLREHLPDYMVPAMFVRLDRFPLTAHGKIDRAALPAPGPENIIEDQSSAAPRTPVERRIAGILTGLLGREDIRRDDNFFFLGGHSLMGAQLLVKLREAFAVELSLRTLFAAPTVAALAAEIERLTEDKPLGESLVVASVP